MDDRTRAKLLHAVTEHDRRQSRTRYYNRFALPQYLGAVERAAGYMTDGASLRNALTRSFNGRLLDACLRAVGEPIATRDEQRWLST